MIDDLRNHPDGSVIEADLCIIGAGPAGISIAREFAKPDMALSGLRVCLIESGGFDFDSETADMYVGETEGHEYYPLDVTRLRFFGGASNHWAGYCIPFNELDFQRRDWVPDSGWPIDYTTLEPYYQRCQELCQIGPFNYNLADALPSDLKLHDFLPEKIEGKVWQFSPPTRFGQVYRRELREAENVRVLLFANVTEIESDYTARRVIGAKLASITGNTARVRAKTFVLACGGLENPRLLLASNSVQTAGLGNGRDLVGRYFMEHPEAGPAIGVVQADGAKVPWYAGFHNWGIDMMPALSLSEEVQRRHQCLAAAAGIEPLAQFQRNTGYFALRRLFLAFRQMQMPENFTSDVWHVLTDLNDAANGTMRWLRGRHYRPSLRMGDTVRVRWRLEQAPDRDNRVVLSDERDALGVPRIRLHWRLNEIDRHTLRVATQVMGEELGRLGFLRLRVEDWLMDDNAPWDGDVVGAFHHMGTTRMSDDPSQGVVDSNCRVHGIENLYIAGSSVFPTGSHAMPTFTLLALALRLADHLRGELAGRMMVRETLMTPVVAPLVK
ncbi:FAD-dependent oxidoreductase [Telmatospirillum sp. J64-1]|uniref:FAD-dependent oxidoreductase n=1 Tax=Telmatospirillum sp. J64-1 TaxID=2502183 RepID=UPI00115F1B23|nr:GMC family oxidoreductase [Telmatospirillum sp. J64-1]